MHRLAAFLQRRSTLFMAASIPFGLAFQDVAATLRPFVLTLSVATIALSLLRIEWAGLADGLRRPLPAITIIAWVLLCCPALAYFVGRAILPSDSVVLSGITLVAAGPPVLSAAVYALMLGADAALMLLVAIPGTALTPITMPLFLSLVPGLEGKIDLVALAGRLLLIVAVSFAVAAALKRAIKPSLLKDYAVWLDAAMVVLMSMTGVAVVSGLTEVLVQEPHLVIVYTASALLLNVTLQAAGWLVFSRANGLLGVSAAILSGNRNMAMLLAAVLGLVSAELELFVVVAQLPLYLLPLVVKPVYGRLASSACVSRRETKMRERKGAL